MFISLAILAVIVAGTLLLRPLTVLLHELGHAITAILLTRKRTTIFVGSMGDPIGSIHFRIGLLEVWFRYNPLMWNYGVCIPSAREVSLTKQILWTLAGPLASTVVAVIAAFVIIANDLHPVFNAILMLFAVSAAVDLQRNLSPDLSPIKLHDGRITHNDGYRLRMLFRSLRLSRQWKKVYQLHQNGRFREAADLCDTLLDQGWLDPVIFRTAISCRVEIFDLDAAVKLGSRLFEIVEPDNFDIFSYGWALSHLGRHEEAAACYQRCLQQDPEHSGSWNNLGYTYALWGNHQAALDCFEKAIAIDEDPSMPMSHKGLALIRLGKTTEGLEMIHASIEMNKERNPYPHLNFGIYQFERGEIDEAYQQFLFVKSKWPRTHPVDEWITKAEAILGDAGPRV